MQKETRSIWFACALGSFIGALIALELNANFSFGKYLWTIGAIIGGIVAYVAVDFQHFCAGVADSYRKTIAWRPDLSYWKAIASMTMATVLLANDFALVAGTISMYFSGDLVETIQATFVLMIIMTCPGVILGLLLSILILYIESVEPKNRTKGIQKLIEDSQYMIKDFNPIRLIRVAFIGLIRLAVRTPSAIRHSVPAVIKAIVSKTRTIARFIAGVVIYVHSSKRVLCFVDAAIGASVGYFVGSSLIGAVVGGLFGVINYEVLSVRVFKLVPRC